MSGLPGDGQYPIYFLTGISFASCADEQQRWQSLHDRNMARLLESFKAHRKSGQKKSKDVLDFMLHNQFIEC